LSTEAFRFSCYPRPKFEARFDELGAKIGAVDSKVESFRRELAAEIRRVEQTLSANFVRMESNVDVRLAAMTENMTYMRRELLAEIKAAAK
jgi:hypothetical protein